jgi:putative tricarboxylic transport membrane protein
MDVFFSGFAVILQPHYLVFMFLGVAMGLIIGFLPGLSGGIGIGLMLPFTFHMDPLTALVFLCSIYSGGIFGGAVDRKSINIRRGSSNLATVLDGFPMARKGHPERAMGLVADELALIGGLFGCTCLLLLAEPLRIMRVKFGPGEMFFVAIFGLTVLEVYPRTL